MSQRLLLNLGLKPAIGTFIEHLFKVKQNQQKKTKVCSEKVCKIIDLKSHIPSSKANFFNIKVDTKVPLTIVVVVVVNVIPSKDLEFQQGTHSSIRTYEQNYFKHSD